YWFVTQSDINTLYNATNKNGNHYNYVYLPLTKKVVKTTTGVSTNSKGSYVNYYVANAVVLVPTYADENDAVAIAIVQGLYPDKQVVGIDCRNMFSWGGMVHCVTQQQPVTCPQACSIPAQLSTTKITTTTAKANWQLQNCSVKYKLRYRKTNSTAWTNVSVAADKSSKVFKNLSVNSPYEWQIRNKCQETPLIQSAWSASQFFTTLPLKNAVAIDQSAFTLYPNPANESVTIQHAMDVDEEVEIEIYDVTGKRWVQLHTVGAGDCTIDLTGFESGLYLVKMGSAIQKLVKE
ncbi:MAG: agmatine deiminase family protein, partial [Chitinophagales bacterium]